MYAIDQENLLTRLADRVVRYTASPFKSLLLAAPISMALSLQPAWVYWFGIPTPGYTLIPPAVPLLIYGYVFGLGWVLSRQRDLLERLGSSWLMRLLIGLGAALLCLIIRGLRSALPPFSTIMLESSTCYTPKPYLHNPKPK